MLVINEARYINLTRRICVTVELLNEVSQKEGSDVNSREKNNVAVPTCHSDLKSRLLAGCFGTLNTDIAQQIDSSDEACVALLGAQVVMYRIFQLVRLYLSSTTSINVDSYHYNLYLLSQ